MAFFCSFGVFLFDRWIKEIIKRPKKIIIQKNNWRDFFCWIHLLPTCVSSSDHLLQDLLFESTQQGLHNHVVVCAGCESHQGGSGGRTGQLDLNKQSEEHQRFPDVAGEAVCFLPGTSAHLTLWQDSKTGCKRCSDCSGSRRWRCGFGPPEARQYRYQRGSLQVRSASGWDVCVRLRQERAKWPGAREPARGETVGFDFVRCCCTPCTPHAGHDHPGRPAHCRPPPRFCCPSLCQAHPGHHRNRWAEAVEGQIVGLDRRKGMKEVSRLWSGRLQNQVAWWWQPASKYCGICTSLNWSITSGITFETCQTTHGSWFCPPGVCFCKDSGWQWF